MWLILDRRTTPDAVRFRIDARRRLEDIRYMLSKLSAAADCLSHTLDDSYTNDLYTQGVAMLPPEPVQHTINNSVSPQFMQFSSILTPHYHSQQPPVGGN